MNTLFEIISVFQAIISGGLVFRIVYCGIKMNTDSDDAAKYKKCIKSALKVGILVVLISSIKLLVETYYK